MGSGSVVAELGASTPSFRGAVRVLNSALLLVHLNNRLSLCFLDVIHG